MLCDDCGKNEAHIHFVQMGPDGRVEKNLCEICAAKYGVPMIDGQMGEFSLGDFLKGLMRAVAEEHREEQEDNSAISCPSCGTSYGDFREQGRIGCPLCYKAFRPRLTPILRRLHGATIHRGKIPKRTGGTLELQTRIRNLREELAEAVKREEYEKAAEYRDQIHALQKQLDERGEMADV